jgi:hypothetical protein
MVASISSHSSGMSQWTDSVFSKLDTKKQGYIEKSDLQSALSGVDGSDTQSSDIDDAFGALDGDGDGKVTKSELTDAMTKLSDQLNAQFDASRANGGGMRPDGPPPGPPPGGAGGAQEQASESGNGATAGTHHEHDPMREFAHALQLLKAYSDDGDSSSTTTGSVSVEA